MILHNVMQDEIVDTGAVDVVVPAAPAEGSSSHHHDPGSSQYQLEQLDRK